jgi:hypothetical protein
MVCLRYHYCRPSLNTGERIVICLIGKRLEYVKMQGEWLLVWGVLFGALGLGFFTYGRSQKSVIPLMAGIALFVVPYFISNVYLLVIAGAALVALPYYVSI